MTQPFHDPSIPQTCEDRNGVACAPADCDLDGAHYCTRESALTPSVPVQPGTKVNMQRQSRRIE